MEYRRQTLNTAFDPSQADYIYRTSINEYNHERYYGRFSVSDFLQRHFLNLMCCCFRKPVDGRIEYYVRRTKKELRPV